MKNSYYGKIVINDLILSEVSFKCELYRTVPG